MLQVEKPSFGLGSIHWHKARNKPPQLSKAGKSDELVLFRTVPELAASGYKYSLALSRLGKKADFTMGMEMPK